MNLVIVIETHLRAASYVLRERAEGRRVAERKREKDLQYSKDVGCNGMEWNNKTGKPTNVLPIDVIMPHCQLLDRLVSRVQSKQVGIHLVVILVTRIHAS
jgi:hypothetical protein